MSLFIQSHDMKDILCQVQADSRNIHLGLLLPRLMVGTPFLPGAIDAVKEAGEAITSITPPASRLEKLSGNRAGQWSMRINDQFRICFRWTEGGADDVEIVDYH